jgi:hypothetical protein
VTIKSAVQKIVEHIRLTGKSQTTAIDELWSSLKLSKGDITDLAKRDGIRFLVSASLTSGTGPEETASPVSVTYSHGGASTPQTIQVSLRILKNTCFQVKDGTERKLFEFRVEDFDYCISRNQSMIEGLERHNEAFSLGKTLLEQYHVSRIDKLPIAQQEAFGESWKNITSKPEEVEEIPA